MPVRPGAGAHIDFGPACEGKGRAANPARMARAGFTWPGGWNASGRTKGWLVEEVQASPHRRTKPFASY